MTGTRLLANIESLLPSRTLVKTGGLSVLRGAVRPLEKECPELTVGRLLQRNMMTLALAESCTGGLISHRITNVPGSSAYFLGAIIAYSYSAKESILGVAHDLLMKHGAVCEEVARQMAIGARTVLGADVGLSVTGIAGPGGASPNKPVGLVYVGLAAPKYQQVQRFVWSGDRNENKSQSAETAFEVLRIYLESLL